MPPNIYRQRHQNPNKSNNFLKQNIFNEKLNITKNLFLWGDLCRVQLFDTSPINLNDGLYCRLKRSKAFARMLPMPTNATSKAVLNDVIEMRLVCDSFNYGS